jgi:hypothetical protein
LDGAGITTNWNNNKKFCIQKNPVRGGT